MAAEMNIELGTLLEEIRQTCKDKKVISFLERLLEFEEEGQYSYKPTVRQLLAECSEGTGVRNEAS